MAKLDRRVRRTHRRLRDALIELILEQGYEQITIQAITDRADLSRATFYLHYKDKDELLASSLEEMFDELVESLEKPTQGNGSRPSTFPVMLVFRHVEEYSDLYKALLLGDRGVTYVMHREIRYIAHIAQQQISALLPESQPDPAIPLPILAHHVAGALFSLILWWLENDMPHSPEEMGHIFECLTVPGVLNAMGLPVDLESFRPQPVK